MGQVYSGVSAFGNSIVNMSGGTVADFLDGYENSTFNISGGSIYGLRGYGNNKISVTQDVDISGISLQDNAAFEIHNNFGVRDGRVRFGTVSGIISVDNGSLLFDHSYLNEVSVYDKSHLTINKGSYIQTLRAGDNSIVRTDASSDYSTVSQIHELVMGGHNNTQLTSINSHNITVAVDSHLDLLVNSYVYQLTVQNNATADIGAFYPDSIANSTPTVTELYTYGNAVATMRSGWILENYIHDNSKLILLGGKIGQNTLHLFDNGSVTLYGTGLSLTFSSAGGRRQGGL